MEKLLKLENDLLHLRNEWGKKALSGEDDDAAALAFLKEENALLEEINAKLNEEIAYRDNVLDTENKENRIKVRLYKGHIKSLINTIESICLDYDSED